MTFSILRASCAFVLFAIPLIRNATRRRNGRKLKMQSKYALTWALYTMCTPWKMMCFEKSSKKFKIFSTWIVYGKPRSRMQFFADPLVMTCWAKNEFKLKLHHSMFIALLSSFEKKQPQSHFKTVNWNGIKRRQWTDSVYLWLQQIKLNGWWQLRY